MANQPILGKRKKAQVPSKPLRVLIALDFSLHSRQALKFIQSLPFPNNAEGFLLHVIDPPPRMAAFTIGYDEYWEKRNTLIREKIFEISERYLAQFDQGNLHVTSLVKEGITSQEILKAIKQLRIDLVVLGPRGLSGIDRFLLGSVSEWLIHHAPCSVLVVRGSPKWAGKKLSRGMRVVVGVDGSHDSQMAQSFIQRRLPLPPSSQVMAFHSLGPHAHLIPQMEDTFGAPSWAELSGLERKIKKAQEQTGRKLLAEAIRTLKRKEAKVIPHLTQGNAGEEIIKLAEKNRADLIVVGSRGLTQLKSVFLGSVSQKVVRYAPCSVLVVR
jgi:nucleotide-binding universal stress UspA family protein